MKSVKKYLKRRIETIDFLLNTPERFYTVSTFHQLHLEIKKLKALIDLIEFCSKDFNRGKIYKPFKRIFRQAGKVRELQVEESMLKKYAPIGFLKEYRHSLKQLRLKEKEKYFLIANKRRVASVRKKYHEILSFISQVDENKANSFMENKKERIEKLINQSSLPPSKIHSLRKQLKRFNYIRKYFDLEKLDYPVPEEIILPQLLGKWHDSQDFVNSLESARNTVIANQAELQQLEKIKEKVTSDIEILLYKINKAIPKSEFFTKQAG
jgi:CHAD domain-containing protein